MRHDWTGTSIVTQVSMGRNIDEFCGVRWRTCRHCMKTQHYDLLGHDRLCGGSQYGWRPLIGRCKGKTQ